MKRKSTSKKTNPLLHPCSTENCDEMCKGKTCSKCNRVFSYWDKKPLGAAYERQKQLDKWRSRMEHINAPLTEKQLKAAKKSKHTQRGNRRWARNGPRSKRPGPEPRGSEISS